MSTQNDIISGLSSDVQSFKSIEACCTQKINEVIETDSDTCKKELASLYNNRGHARYMQVEFETAVEDYNKALHLNPNLAVAYYNRATILYRMGCFNGAIKDMQKAIDLEPSNVEFSEGYNECGKMTNMHTQ